MEVLDARLSKRKPQPVGMVAKKVRQIGVPSKSHPPLNAPDWAVSPSKSSPYYYDGCLICISLSR